MLVLQPCDSSFSCGLLGSLSVTFNPPTPNRSAKHNCKTLHIDTEQLFPLHSQGSRMNCGLQFSNTPLPPPTIGPSLCHTNRWQQFRYPRILLSGRSCGLLRPRGLHLLWLLQHFEHCRQRDGRKLLAPGAWSCRRLRSRKTDVRWLEAWNKQRSIGDSDEHNNERGSGTEPLMAMTNPQAC